MFIEKRYKNKIYAKFGIYTILYCYFKSIKYLNYTTYGRLRVLNKYRLATRKCFEIYLSFFYGRITV